MALIDEAKTWLRVSTCDADINAQIEMLVESAISDLTNTADVSKTCFEGEDIDPLLKNAVMVYVQAYWSDSEDRQAKLMTSYDSIKAKLVMSSMFNGSEA